MRSEDTTCCRACSNCIYSLCALRYARSTERRPMPPPPLHSVTCNRVFPVYSDFKRFWSATTMIDVIILDRAFSSQRYTKLSTRT